MEWLWFLAFLGAVGGLVGAPIALYNRYHRLYGQSDSFALRWTELTSAGPFRGANSEFEGRFEMSPHLRWVTKMGFFLGILGFLWTPLVLLGVSQGMRPMITVGLPGLAVSWSIFFTSRAVLIHGPSAAPRLRQVALAEIALNVWVLVVVVLSTLLSASGVDATFIERVSPFLLLGGPGSVNLSHYTIPYALQQGGFLAVGYALLSFSHAALALKACATLDQARLRQGPLAA